MTEWLDPAATLESIRRNLVGLKMARALEVLDQTLGQIEPGQIGAVEAIDMLLTEELTLRQTRRVRMALMTARITAAKTLASFDFAFQPSLDRNRVLALAGLDFIDRREAVHLLGQPARPRAASLWPWAWRQSKLGAGSTSRRWRTSLLPWPRRSKRTRCASASASSRPSPS